MNKHSTTGFNKKMVNRHILDPECGLGQWFVDRGHPPYRATQVRSWIFQQRATTFEEMTNLPRDVRNGLAEEFQIWSTSVEERQTTEDGTDKLLLALADGGRIECVLLRDGSRRTICISTQVGCAMGCVFCASGLNGVERNLTSGEILEQALKLQMLLPENERLSHVVVMGMGEPLANLNALLPALAAARDPNGMGISTRRITISTVGLPQAIQRLADLGIGYHLAVSLHAADDALRDQLVPVNKKNGLQPILAAADRYFESSGRRLTFEYVLLADVNDRERDAQRLVELLRGRSALLNLIPYNPVDGLVYRTPSTKSLSRFRSILTQGGLNVKVRQRKGDKINAACGQLRRRSV